jgi:hypothetical protein
VKEGEGLVDPAQARHVTGSLAVLAFVTFLARRVSRGHGAAKTTENDRKKELGMHGDARGL